METKAIHSFGKLTYWKVIVWENEKPVSVTIGGEDLPTQTYSKNLDQYIVDKEQSI